MSRTWGSSEVVDAHGHCIRNRHEIEQSTSCGCFYCMTIFPPAEIEEWIEDEVTEGPQQTKVWKAVTANCPRCGIDSVLGDASGFPVTNIEFLRAMNRHWF